MIQGLWCRDAALAWEKAFIHLAQTRLQDLAAQANLKLSFSSERSVEDELARETASDSVTVAVSYLVMLLYIALALGTLPAGSSSWAVLVYSRVGVGLTGVMIVGLSVLAALGLCSLFGMWATLIILEVKGMHSGAPGILNCMSQRENSLPELSVVVHDLLNECTSNSTAEEDFPHGIALIGRMLWFSWSVFRKSCVYNY